MPLETLAVPIAQRCLGDRGIRVQMPSASTSGVCGLRYARAEIELIPVRPIHAGFVVVP